MTATPTTNISYQNFFSATLTADMTATSTDVFLDVVPNGTEGFLVIDPDSTTAREVIYFNSKTVTKVVCPSVADGRGQDDTTAGAHLTGTTVIMAPVAAYYEALLSLFTTSPQGWTSVAGSISGATYNGNRSYTLTTSTDQTAVVSPGMRLRTTRTVLAPTQSTSLNGTTQYYSKTTPAGMTFTDDFVVSAWVKLSSYQASSIITRYNGTSGWTLQVDSSGRPNLYGYNAASGNNSGVISYQSLPLNKWVHVTAQLDMSAFTATPTTSYIMFDGVDVPASVTRAGTNPTALIQAGDLQIGATNGSVFFPGKIAQAAVFSAKVTQATMRGYISQGLAGTETSLISAYSFNNSFTDLNTTNANNLTANGSAVATNADSPFGGQANGTISSTLDYGIVQTVSASTIVVQVAEGCTIPTSGGVASASYSTYKMPFGFPGQKGKWSVELWSLSSYNRGATVSGAYYMNHLITIPIGEWAVGFQGSFYQATSAAGVHNSRVGLDTTSASVPVTSPFTSQLTTVNITESSITFNKSSNVSLSAATPYYVNAASTGITYTVFQLNNASTPVVITADNAYL